MKRLLVMFALILAGSSVTLLAPNPISEQDGSETIYAGPENIVRPDTLKNARDRVARLEAQLKNGPENQRKYVEDQLSYARSRLKALGAQMGEQGDVPGQTTGGQPVNPANG